MNALDTSRLTQADGATTTPGYMPGFGNDYETEALPGALPQGMNSPQKCNYGLRNRTLTCFIKTVFRSDLRQLLSQVVVKT